MPVNLERNNCFTRAYSGSSNYKTKRQKVIKTQEQYQKHLIKGVMNREILLIRVMGGATLNRKPVTKRLL